MGGKDDSEAMNADNYVLELYKSKSFNESFWGGVKV